MLTGSLYKILTPEDYQTAQSAGITQTTLDAGDGYVHLSTREQVGETLALHYSGQTGVHLLEFLPEGLGDLRWEPSRGGDLFPHLYGPLKMALIKREWVLLLGPDNAPQLPEDL